MNVTTTQSYGSMSDRWAHRALLQRSKPKNIHNQFGRAFTMPQKNTLVMAFRRQENLNSDPVVLPEGQDPAPELVQKFDINVTMQEFGKVTLLSRTVLLVVEDDTANETADNLSQCMHTMLDKVTREVLAASTAQISSLNGVNGNAITELTQTDVDRAIQYLDDNDTELMTPVIQGTNRYGTGPVEEGYWVLFNVNLKPDIRALDSFTPTSQYASQEPVLQCEFGATDDARWCGSTLVKKTNGNPVVYYNTFIGANAYGYVSIDKVSTEVIMKPLGFNDYLNRYQAMGFTAWFNAVVLDDSHLVTLLSTKG